MLYINTSHSKMDQAAIMAAFFILIIAVMKYIKPLDTVRFFAAALVLLFHLLPIDKVINHDLGTMGVVSFFVLSGFLITSILLNYRHEEPGKAIKRFYFRRALRIFPLYFFVIASLCLLFTVPVATGKGLPYLLTYTYNFYHHIGFEGLTFHFWTLSVEEQFYFVWPALILFLPVRFLLPVISLFVISGTILQAAFPLFIFNVFHVHTFAIGASLSWIVKYRRNWMPVVTKVALPFFIIIMGSTLYFEASWMTEEYYYSIIAVSLIAYAVGSHKSQNPVYKLIFCNPVFVYLGRISYGLYVYHVPIFILTEHPFKRFNLAHLPSWYRSLDLYINFIEYVTLTIIIASISYYLIEKPFLNLKNRVSVKYKAVPA